MRTADPIGLAKAILWEEAKGKLRAIVAAEGAQEGGHGPVHRDGPFPFEKIEKAVEDFIRDFEDNGLHE